MKKLLGLLVCAGLIMGFCPATFAAAVLDDSELGELYAGHPESAGVDIDINKIMFLKDAAALAQSNIGGLVANGTSNTANLNQNNVANVANQGKIKNVNISKTKNKNYLNSFNTLTLTKTITKTKTDVTVGDVDLDLDLQLNKAMCGSNIATGSGDIATTLGNTGQVNAPLGSE